MEKPGFVKIALLFVVILMTIGINLEDNMINRLGFDANYLIMALVAVVFTGLLAFRNLMLIVLVLLLCVGTNMPEELMVNFGLDRDYLTGILVAIVIVPVLGKLFDI